MSAVWQEMETLLDRLERLGDPAVRQHARALVQLLLRLHSDALVRLVEITRQAGQGLLLDAWKEDAQVNALLLMHGLHPDDLASRVRRALLGVAPLAAFLGIEVSPLRVSEQEVRFTLACAADIPAEALKELCGRVEAAVLNQAPEVGAVCFEGGARRLALPLLGEASRGQSR
jgi:hypothetical protein